MPYFLVFAFVWLCYFLKVVDITKNLEIIQTKTIPLILQTENEDLAYNFVTVLYGLFLECGQEPKPVQRPC